MTNRQILFSAPMIRALLAGRKTQTRRVVKGDALDWLDDFTPAFVAEPGNGLSPYGHAGDLLWVRENCRGEELADGQDGVRYVADDAFRPIENTAEAAERWGVLHCYAHKASYERANGSMIGAQVPSIHMPRWASRITLPITELRIERLNDISGADAMAEGITSQNIIIGTSGAGGRHTEETADRFFFDGCADEGFETAAEAYIGLWNHINGPDADFANPWVWVVSFEPMRQNIDAFLATYEAPAAVA